MSRSTKQPLDLATVRALLGDDQSFSQRTLILELVDRCEKAEGLLNLAAQTNPMQAPPEKKFSFQEFVTAITSLQSKGGGT